MTRYTNVGRKRNFVEAGFDGEKQEKPEDTSIGPQETPGLAGDENGGTEKKKRRKNVASSTNVEENQREGHGIAENGGKKKPFSANGKMKAFRKGVMVLLSSKSIFLTQNLARSRFAQDGVGDASSRTNTS